jgi:hypothetical protein
MLVGTVAAAPLAAGTATLVGVEYVPGKGPVFTFSVSGKLSKADLKGSLQVEGGANYDLHYTKVDDSTVTCTASKKVGARFGHMSLRRPLSFAIAFGTGGNSRILSGQTLAPLSA